MCHAWCGVDKFVFVDACATWCPLESGVDVSRCEMVEFGPDVVFWRDWVEGENCHFLLCFWNRQL